MNKLSVIIPTFNEEGTILNVLRKVLKLPETGEIIIVDDGSKDNTKSLLEKFKKDSKDKRINLIRHKTNRGKGAAIVTGIKNCKLNYLIIQDADLEYNPKEYKNLLKSATPKCVVYGSRLMTHNAHAYTRTYLGNLFITSFCNILFGTKLTDSYTCYKLIPTHIAKSLKLKSTGFEIEAEITGKLAKRKIPIIEVPISYNPRKYEEGKKIRGKDALIGAITYLKILFS